jgi:hypothetical protein
MDNYKKALEFNYTSNNLKADRQFSLEYALIHNLKGGYLRFF